ncbi:Uracil transporter [Acholeplasma oculi]|uniref:Xanthine/uracil/vitamin C permease n=1 Tax=Acholeplasma oculi TaxID=35623 RepID=A0A061A9M0_9MOLU|nr:solute carrier family 23 protein [Acholeplasma oculi]CDR30094.1 Xanthine/uracil/vitamin C permease [Acholeplasma oculi]SKC44866.1 uracil permease [Acholeplasma oculi]SUT88368.1 Uracil transporter [Acholeplasma oculi]
MNKHGVVGYLPDEKPSLGKAIVFALQQFLVMLPATVLAAIIMNGFGMEIYSIPAAILASGVATISFLLITGFKIPLYYGSSFSYIGAVAIVVTYGVNNLHQSSSVLGSVLIASVISGFMSIGAGLLIRYFGKDKIDKVLPGHITGMIAMIIGLSLAGNVMGGILNVNNNQVDWLSVLVALVTFLTISILTVVLKKGFISQIPILIGLVVGVTLSYLLWVPSLGATWSFENLGTYLQGINDAPTIGMLDVMPWVTIPAALNTPNLIGIAIIAIFPIAFATIPESAAHVNQIDLYVNNLSKDKEGKDYMIREMLDDNLIGDGVGDIVAVLLGGPAGTNYGENVSASAVTKNFSSYVFFITGILAILVGLLLEILKLGDLSLILTNPVVQGVSLYLFGAIAVQGIALMIEKKVDIFDPKIIAVMAFIGIVGLGVASIPVTENFVLPGIGVAAIGGILLNLLLNAFSNIKKD